MALFFIDLKVVKLGECQGNASCQYLHVHTFLEVDHFNKIQKYFPTLKITKLKKKWKWRVGGFSTTLLKLIYRKLFAVYCYITETRPAAYYVVIENTR